MSPATVQRSWSHAIHRLLAICRLDGFFSGCALGDRMEHDHDEAQVDLGRRGLPRCSHRNGDRALASSSSNSYHRGSHPTSVRWCLSVGTELLSVSSDM